MASVIPAATVSRLVTYQRILHSLEHAGVYATSSDELGQLAHVSAFQVRKDLAHFGRFGTRGAGYTVATLHQEVVRILGLNRLWNIAIMGMGRLGQALVDYPNFDREAFRLVAAFDVAPDHIGRRYGELTVQGVEELPQAVRERHIDLAFLTVPAAAAQGAADKLVAAGIRGILSFAPAVVNVPPGVRVEPVDLAAGLQRLTYYVRDAESPVVAR
jgi:redox-sensing transcriptional repressor